MLSQGEHGSLSKQKVTGALPFLSQKVGLTLRKLIGSVDSILPSLPASSRTEVSVLVSDRASGSPSPPPAPAVVHPGGSQAPWAASLLPAAPAAGAPDSASELVPRGR